MKAFEQPFEQPLGQERAQLDAEEDGELADAEFVMLGMPDVNGSLRGKALRPAAFRSALREGSATTDLLLALDTTDSPITDYEWVGIRSGAGDLMLHPDRSTLRELTWRPGWRVCLGTPYWPDGRRCEVASREVLRAALQTMSSLGLSVMAAFEYEVRIFEGDRPLSSGTSYSFEELAGFDELIDRLTAALSGLRVELSAIHTEAGPGLLEINIAAREGLAAADDATFVKLAISGVAAQMGLRASFLAKTAAGEEGSSGHVHLSCWSGETNAFGPDPSGGQRTDLELPGRLGAAVAGVLEHLPAASLMLNPTINSYKRLVPGWFAPTNVSWGFENRSAAVRAIRSPHARRWRLECRRPGADANPYLALAALVVSAADGIRRNAAPPPPVVGDVSEQPALPELPGSLESALAAFEADEYMQEALGAEFCSYYAISRAWELKAWRAAVSDWERGRYDRGG